jgi:hypothetical protein
MAELDPGDDQRHIVADIAMNLMVTPRAVPVTARLHYFAEDPYAVEATFSRPGHSDVVWVFARELLMTGIARECGTGDIRIAPVGDTVVFDLESPEGAARLTAASTDVRSFVTRMLTIVPAGTETACLDLDAELAGLATGTAVTERRKPR